MAVHIHSKIAHEVVKPGKENIRKAIRHLLFSCSEAMTASEILREVRAYMQDDELTINSIAPRITEMLAEKPPRLYVVGHKAYKRANGRSVRSRTLCAMTPGDQHQWEKEEERISQAQQTLF